jgi:hypothetical protein
MKRNVVLFIFISMFVCILGGIVVYNYTPKGAYLKTPLSYYIDSRTSFSCGKQDNNKDKNDDLSPAGGCFGPNYTIGDIIITPKNGCIRAVAEEHCGYDNEVSLKVLNYCNESAVVDGITVRPGRSNCWKRNYTNYRKIENPLGYISHLLSLCPFEPGEVTLEFYNSAPPENIYKNVEGQAGGENFKLEYTVCSHK